MNNRRFKIETLKGKFKRLNLYAGLETDLYTILSLFDQVDELSIKKYKEGYRVKIFKSSDFYVKFIELENY